MSDVTPVLVDRRNVDIIIPEIVGLVAGAPITGVDLETQDDKRHAGLNAFMQVKNGVKSKTRPLVFDTRRTVITGCSFYPDGHDHAYYLNLAHADIQNRIPFDAVRAVLDAKPDTSIFVAHNAAFEKVMLGACHGYDLDAICTMQLAVTAYANDEYEVGDFQSLGIGPILPIIQAASAAFRDYDRARGMTQEQADLFGKFTAKESDAAHSYNGWTDTISKPYGLKQLVKYWFGVEMATFEQTLRGHRHMGELTGEETCAYGADDSVWAVRVYHRLIQYLMERRPSAIKTFFEQENPVVSVFSDVQRTGVRIAADAVEAKRLEERVTFAASLRKMRKAVRELLPFGEPHPALLEEEWYANNGESYRKKIAAWAKQPDGRDDLAEAMAVAGAVSSSWAAEDGLPKPAGLNLTHYMPARVLMYDLTQQKVVRDKGKVSSNAEARGRVLDRLRKGNSAPAIALIEGMTEIAGIEQRAKLYLNPYRQLVDPETSRVYPVMSCELATRRMGMRNPNGTQLGKYGESVYVRGFYEPDNSETDVIISADWSSIELVMIAELSQDPEFRKAFGQIPYEDLHLGAAVDILNAEHPHAGLTTEVFKTFKTDHRKLEQDLFHGVSLINPKGIRMTPSECYGYNRSTSGGKGANFNYWYSGALSSLGDKRGWTPDIMWAATERYRERFAVAEAWRVRTIEEGADGGYVELPDGLRRVRYEATPEWERAFKGKFQNFIDRGIQTFVQEAARKIRRRAGNQLVNAKIQGSCAAMMKRSLIRLRAALRDTTLRARIMFSIHDEMLISCHRDDVLPVIALIRKIMCDQRGIIDTLPLNVSVALGRNFQPFHSEKATLGQVELDEAPSNVLWVPEEKWGKKLDDLQIEAVISHLFARAA